ncbi:hypothetical protein CHL74_11460 [Prevotella sp. 885]|nr:hypothetical protein CHL74_11460 [Prevotella sp. 885]
MENGLYESNALDTHPPNYIMSDAAASLCQQKEKHKKHKVIQEGLYKSKCYVCNILCMYDYIQFKLHIQFVF